MLCHNLVYHEKAFPSLFISKSFSPFPLCVFIYRNSVICFATIKIFLVRVVASNMQTHEELSKEKNFTIPRIIITVSIKYFSC